MSGRPQWKKPLVVEQPLPGKPPPSMPHDSASASTTLSTAPDTQVRHEATLLTNHYEIVKTATAKSGPATTNSPPASKSPVKSTASKVSVSSPSKATAARKTPPKSPVSKQSGSSPPKSPGSKQSGPSSPQGLPATTVAINDIQFFRYNLTFTRELTEDEIKRRAEKKAKEEKKAKLDRKAKEEKKAKEPEKPADDQDPDTLENKLQPAAKAKRRLIYLLLKKLAEEDKISVNVASDYNSFLVTCSRLPPGVTGNNRHRIVLYGDHEQYVTAYPVYHITIKEGPRLLTLDELAASQKGTPGVAFTRVDQKNTVDALNALFTHIANQATFKDRLNSPRATMTRVGSKKFFELKKTKDCGPWDMKQEAEGLQARTGFFISVRLPKGPLAQPLLNINTTTSAIRPSGNLDTLLRSHGNANILQLASVLEGVQVHTTHIADPVIQRNQLRHKFSELAGGTVALSQAANVTFNITDINGTNTTTTVVQYFQANYPNAGVVGTDLVVDVGSGQRRTFIPAKLLVVEPEQVFTRSTKMVNEAARRPDANRNLIQVDGKDMFGVGRQVGLGHLSNLFAGLSIRQNMLPVHAKVLEAPKVSYLGAITNPALRKGKWNLQQQRFARSGTAKTTTWSVLSLQTTALTVRARYIQDFQTNLQTGMQRYGLQATKWPRQNNLDPLQTFASAGRTPEEWLERLTDIQKKGVDVLFVLLPSKHASFYTIIKQIGDLELGLQTICHVCDDQKPKNPPRNFPAQWFGPKTDPNTIANLLLKFNLKSSQHGVNQQFAGERSYLLEGDTMLMGMDVTHAGAGAMKGAPSIAAVVGSIDDRFAQFPAVLEENQRRVPLPGAKYGLPSEEIHPLDKMVKISIERWKTKNGRLPTRIIVFRDGLSEEQIEDVCKQAENKRINDALTELYGKNHPKVITICTVKRHHTRFFGDNRSGKNVQDEIFRNPDQGPNESAYLDNPVPGTLVDNGVVLDEAGPDNEHDFFLISHHVFSKKGTARPTHYVVTRNDVEAKKLDLAIMTHSLCYLFGRSTTSVSVATPSYYADLACDRARFYVRDAYVGRSREEYDEEPETLNDYMAVHPRMSESMFYI
ncbi:Protein argonaute 1D [Cyphellophora attinorum]|uniref:Protein argonaute 1D n=1 Tax=Cyphellophora attinorum TaxID=1664694 RepID=A0A0N1NVX4_9EURO|nr:Protein argonaute 1D [Phialophora attinorum]KPI35807.1 Protein argonaute 1D [Phialophora attinorum]